MSVMPPFSYQRAMSVAHAVQGLRDDAEAKLLGGGQSLIAAMKLGFAAPSTLIDVTSLPGLGEIVETQDAVQLGAAVTHARSADSQVIQARIPGLARLAGGIADAQVRNRGTLGGSLAYNDPAACWPAGVLALGATVITDRREIAADDYFCGMFASALAADEVITAVRFPVPLSFAYAKFEQAASRFALVGVAVARFGNQVRCAITGSAAGAIRVNEIEARLTKDFSVSALEGLRLSEDNFGSDIHAQADYRAHLAVVMTKRAIATCLANA
jgi:aerobic carbon-monoxide dehydrogenase medium subunit